MYVDSATRKEAQAIAVLAYIVRDGMVLLIKRGFPPYRGFWCFPGGGTREDEDLREACIREVKEETGLCVEIIEQVHEVRGSPVYSCKIIAGEPTRKLPETTGIAWVPLSQFIKVPPFIRDFLERQTK